ncbi:MAG: hypothetical protein HGA55_08050, partial [Methanoregulaceae archaeon]|nr:hypothetical protein [Methanoregulaceae archaeon]
MQSWDITPPSPENSVPLPDLALLFALPPPPSATQGAPFLPVPGTLPERKRPAGFSRYAGCFARFFDQLPARKTKTGLAPGQELKWSVARKIALARDLYRCRRCSTPVPGLLTDHHVFP